MSRDLGPFAPKRPHKLNAPLIAMLLNGVHDRHAGRVFVLQVGPGDGETGLTLLPRLRGDGWSALLIEPHPDHFARLEALHTDSDRVAILNLGLSDAAATLPLHSLSAAALERLPKAPRGRASLDPARVHVEGTGPDDLQSHDVPVLRMQTVLSELGIDRAQLVLINAGGAEAKVLCGFDLAGLQPSVTLVHSRPDTPEDDASIKALAAADLLVFRIGDYLAGLRPGAVAVPMDELLTFFNKGVGQRQDQDTPEPHLTSPLNPDDRHADT